jgi:REP element-mobilizing transposase RayT
VIPGETDMDMPLTISFRRRNLPHWRVEGRPYFITIRLKNSIPAGKIAEIKAEYEKKYDELWDDEVLFNYFQRQFVKMESILDATKDNLYLSNKDVAGMIMKSIDWIEINSGWRIPASVVMPNHVHLFMVGEAAKRSLDKCLTGFKAHTAREANKILGRKGAFWCPECFDHWCRTPQKEESVKSYIKNNPAKAGLVKRAEDWPWLKMEKSSA